MELRAMGFSDSKEFVIFLDNSVFCIMSSSLIKNDIVYEWSFSRSHGR